MAIKNAFYAQSGGVTAVINASACGVIQTARKHPDQIGKVYAGRNGIIGALKEELIDTSLESDDAIQALIQAAVQGHDTIDGEFMTHLIATHPLYQSHGAKP